MLSRPPRLAWISKWGILLLNDLDLLWENAGLIFLVGSELRTIVFGKNNIVMHSGQRPPRLIHVFASTYPSSCFAPPPPTHPYPQVLLGKQSDLPVSSVHSASLNCVVHESESHMSRESDHRKCVHKEVSKEDWCQGETKATATPSHPTWNMFNTRCACVRCVFRDRFSNLNRPCATREATIIRKYNEHNQKLTTNFNPWILEGLF